MPTTALRLAAVAAFGLFMGCTDGVSAAAAKARAGDPSALCHASCEYVSTCNAVETFEGVPACSASCTSADELWSEPCREATTEFLECELRLSCGELRSLLGAADHRSTGPCEAERQASEACQPAAEPFIYFQF